MLYAFFYSLASHSFLASTIWWPFDYFQIMSWFLTVLSPCFGFTIYTSDSGEMCAMKEVTLFSDDPKSKESAKQLGQVWFLKCASTYTMSLPQQQKDQFIYYYFPFSVSFILSFSGNIALEPLTTPKYRTILWHRNGINCCLQLLFTWYSLISGWAAIFPCKFRGLYL